MYCTERIARIQSRLRNIRLFRQLFFAKESLTPQNIGIKRSFPLPISPPRWSRHTTMKRISLLQQVSVAVVTSPAAARGTASSPAVRCRNCSNLHCQRAQHVASSSAAPTVTSFALRSSSQLSHIPAPRRNQTNQRLISTSSRRTSSWPAAVAQQEDDVDTTEDDPALRPPIATRTRAGPMLEQDPSVVTLQQQQSSSSEQAVSPRRTAPTSTSGEASQEAQLPPPPRQKTVLYLSNMKKQKRPM